MVDIFLMGTAGNSKWREPIKAECTRLGISCFDPVVPQWNEEARKRETEALQTARVVIMAITSETAGIASLAESGWAAVSAMMRGQTFCIYVDPVFGDEDQQGSTGMTGFGGWLSDLFGARRTEKAEETIDEASRRARKLVISHLTQLKTQYPELKVHMSGSMEGLMKWAIDAVRKHAAQITQQTSQVHPQSKQPPRKP